MSSERLLDPAFIRRLEGLRVAARRAFPGTTKGERRSTRRGSSVEFADFRDYSRGDDLRHLDWNIFARLERPMLRLFVEEEDVRVDILIDASRSMAVGAPHSKFDYARRVAAALGYLCVAGLDRVGVGAFSGNLGPRVRAVRGRGQLFALLRFLEGLVLDDAPRTDLASALARFSTETRRPGILFVVSDFLDDSSYILALEQLAQRRFDVNLIQVLAPEEAEPPLGGDLTLVDAESGETRDVTVNAATAAAYARALGALQSSLEALAASHGILFASVTTDVPFEVLMLRQLRDRRLLGG